MQVVVEEEFIVEQQEQLLHVGQVEQGNQFQLVVNLLAVQVLLIEVVAAVDLVVKEEAQVLWVL